MLARIRKSIKEQDAGFTLVELLVVMIIIGILAAIAIPVFLNQRTKAVDTGIKSDMRSSAQTVETEFVDTQAYPVAADWTKVGTNGTGTAGTIASTQRTSGVNLIQYKRISETAYCLRGSATNANATGGTGTNAKYFWYSSATGGLVAGAPKAAQAGC